MSGDITPTDPTAVFVPPAEIDPLAAAAAMWGAANHLPPGDERYPAEVAVYCDSCGALNRRTYLVSDADDQATRFGYARMYLRDEHDWRYDGERDLCGTCAPLPTRQQIWDVISSVRDAAPRVPNDASTDDIIDALVDAGLLKLRGDHG